MISPSPPLLHLSRLSYPNIVLSQVSTAALEWSGHQQMYHKRMRINSPELSRIFIFNGTAIFNEVPISVQEFDSFLGVQWQPVVLILQREREREKNSFRIKSSSIILCGKEPHSKYAVCYNRQTLYPTIHPSIYTNKSNNPPTHVLYLTLTPASS